MIRANKRLEVFTNRTGASTMAPIMVCKTTHPSYIQNALCLEVMDVHLKGTDFLLLLLSFRFVFLHMYVCF